MLTAFRRYDDEKALNIHMASEPVKAMIKYMTETPSALVAPPIVMTMTPLAGFTRPELASYDDPSISFVTLGSGEEVEMMGSAAAMAATESEKDPALLCGIALRDVKEPVVRLLRAGRRGVGSEESDGKSVPLKIVAGYLYKDPSQGRAPSL